MVRDVYVTGSREVLSYPGRDGERTSRGHMTTADLPRPPLPPFTDATAAEKARKAEDAWNSRDPARVALAYTHGSRWRNRAEFPGRPPGHRSLPRPQMGARTRLSFDQRGLGPSGQPHRRPLRLRVARRQRPLVSQLRQRELGVRRQRPHEPSRGEHQRSADQGGGSEILLAARPAPARPPGPHRPWSLASFRHSWFQLSRKHSRLVPLRAEPQPFSR